ncbi:MAG: TonB-dependent receptor [Gemmatimonadales bacterium]
MRFRWSSLVRALLVAGGVLGVSQSGAAQGVTSAAVQGIVTSGVGAPIEGANVVLLNTQTGVRLLSQSRNNGRYNFENVAPGGPYTIEIRAIGFEMATRSGVVLTLGQRYTAHFELKPQVVTLEELAVIAVTNPLINSGRTGPASTITDTAIQSLPLLGRNFTSLLNANPQVIPGRTGGVSIAGQNNRFNNIQVDGGVNNDVFGLPSSGTPGGQASAKPLSLEALKEFQVLIAPFDVRYGSFSGGLVNAVTKSGTNEFHGSLFGYLQRPGLVGADTAGGDIADFDINQYGFTLGGPLVRNKAHFFVAGDFQSRSTPYFGFEAGEPATGIEVATADRVRTFLMSNYGFDPGGVTPPVLKQPDNNFFAKVNWQLTDKHTLEVSNNYVKASDDNFSRSTRNRNNRDGWMLSNSGYAFTNKTNSTRVKLTSTVGNASNELLVGYQTVRDRRASTLNDVPLILVQGDVAGNYIAAGSEKFSQANSLDQNVLEITDNFTFGVGNHQLTIGTHNEIFSFVNTFFAGSKGVWTFNSVADLEARNPGRYELQLETRPGGGTADWGVRQIGGYVQDRFSPVANLWITLGLRFDVPFMDKPVENTTLSGSVFGVNTSEFPSGNVLFSPRVGFNYDVNGMGNTVIRGGAGIFSGRPPFVWLSNAFTNTGLEQVTLTCTGAAIPTFTADGNNQPTVCASGGPPSPPIASVNYFDPNTKFQQAAKFSLGLDQQLGWGMVGTVDLLLTRGRNTLYFIDENTVEEGVNGEGRMMYGTPNGSGGITRSRLSTSFGQVIRHENRSEDRSFLATAQLQKRFSSGVEFNVAYTYSKTKDLFSLGSSTAGSNLLNTPLVGTLENRDLQVSAFDVPHKISVSGSFGLPYGVGLSVIYNGRSGNPFAYIVNGDVNGDGLSTNDLIYVPSSASDISLATASDYATLDAFIEGEACLRESRGQIMERNTCRNPWSSFVDMRLSKFFRTVGGQGLEISADFFNLLNLINGDWGLIRESNLFEQKTLLNLTGYDDRGTPSTADDRGIYSLSTNNFYRDRVQVLSSRWRIQLGAKYVF